MTPTEHPCRARPGNTWYSFTAGGHTLGLSDVAGRTLDLHVEETDTGLTLVVVDEHGEPAVDSAGRTSALAIPKPPKETS